MEQVELSSNKLFMPIDKSVDFVDFYKKEATFLAELYGFEKSKAQQSIREVIQSVTNYSIQNEENQLKFYLITLSGLISRHMVRQQFPAETAFGFNSICLSVIEEKLSIIDANNVADELIELFLYINQEKQKPTLMHHTVNKVVAYIDDEIESPMSVEGLAHTFEISTSHLSRIFREYAGITLVEYINMKKVEESQYFLRFTSNKITDISQHFNFCNQSYYTRVFKKYTGETPRRFRNQVGDNYFKFTFSKEKIE